MGKRVVLITGCSSGFGFDTALFFARNGDSVFAGVRDLQGEGAKQLEEISHTENLLVSIIDLDITNELSVHKAVSLIEKKCGKVDILVNCAGGGYLGPIELVPVEEITKQYDVNVFGTMRVIQEVIPLMRRQKSGKIITISSIQGLISFPYWGVYSSSKFALESLMQALRFELETFGIEVALLEPGSFRTNFSKNRKIFSQKKDNEIYKTKIQTFFQTFDALESYAANNIILSKLVDPMRVAKYIYKISQQKNPPLHNIIGLDAKILYVTNKILPKSWWNFLIKKAIYKNEYTSF